MSSDPQPVKRVAPPRASSSWVPARLGRRTYFPIGLVLLAAAIFIYAADWRLPFLTALREDPDYSLYSGLIMGAYLLVQLMMPALRAGGAVPHKVVVRAHKLLGAIGPLLLVVHAERAGYGYLGALSAAFLASSGLGLLNHETLGLKGRVPAFAWMVAHVALSTALCALVAVHVYVALAYE